MDEEPYFITNKFYRKMCYWVSGKHRWRQENPVLFKEAMERVWAKFQEGNVDFPPADDYVNIQREREGLPHSRYPLGSENPFFEERISEGMRAIFMLRSHCKEKFLCCKLCKKDLSFYDIGIYGD